MCDSAILGCAAEHFESDSRNLAGMFLHNSEQSPSIMFCRVAKMRYKMFRFLPRPQSRKESEHLTPHFSNLGRTFLRDSVNLEMCWLPGDNNFPNTGIGPESRKTGTSRIWAALGTFSPWTWRWPPRSGAVRCRSWQLYY